jgi:hypothetical protein
MPIYNAILYVCSNRIQVPSSYYEYNICYTMILCVLKINLYSICIYMYILLYIF